MATIFETFSQTALRYPDRPAIGFLLGGEIVHWTYRELLQKIEAMAMGFYAMGLTKGDRVALLTSNHPLWPVIDLAIAERGLVLVPIHTTLTVEQIAKILAQSRAKALVLGPGVEGKLANLFSQLPPDLKALLFIENKGHEEYPLPPRDIFVIPQLLGKCASESQKPEPVPLQGEDLATIIFTSGTTGEMKGVLLTHQGLIDSSLYGNELVGASKDEVLLSVLPLSHAFERCAGLLAPLFYGSLVNYGRGIFELVGDLEVFRPTRFNAVPRLLEKMRSGILDTLREKSQKLFQLFSRCVEESRNYRIKKGAGAKVPWGTLFWHHMGERIFYKKLRRKLGGRLVRIICGGAPIDPEVVWFFEAVGIQILQGYGLTELSPNVSVNPFWKNKIGSVGIPVKCLQVKIGPNEEILVKGSSLMRGYDNEAATREAIDAEGWFHTGDQGEIDEEGYLYIKGRVKELIVTSYGKNIIPSWVEQVIEKSPLIQQAAVFGHGKAFLAALLVPNREATLTLLPTEMRGQPWEKLCEAPEAHRLIQEELKRVQEALPSHEQVKRFRLLPEEFTMANDLLTPTLKLKRPKIAERYAKEIGKLFGD